MRRFVMIALLVAAPLAASPWDRDRPGDNYVASVADACSGRFDRMPPKYYEMRIERLSAAVAGSKLDSDAALNDADDLLVAYLRLGRLPEAMALVERKALAVDVFRAADARLYAIHTDRMLKNRAMCLLARWRAQGDRADLAKAVEASLKAESMARQIAENTYLSRELEFLRRRPTPADSVFPNPLNIVEANFVGAGKAGMLKKLKLGGAIEHLVRRVTYGGEWDNADLFYALELTCALEGRDKDAALAWARACELIDGGARLAATHNLSPEALKSAIGTYLSATARSEAPARLAAAKSEATIWREARAADIAAALEHGEHPDTDNEFWKHVGNPAWTRPSAAAAPTSVHDEPLVGTALLVGGGAAVVFLFLVVGGVAIYFARRHPPSPKVDEL